MGNRATVAFLRVKVQPRASRNELVELRTDGVLKVRVTASPVRGQANQAVIELLASILSIPRNSVHIASGQRNRDKLLQIDGLDQVTLDSLLDQLFQWKGA